MIRDLRKLSAHPTRPFSDGPVGVVDSGVGGAAVTAVLSCALPEERFLFLGDDEACPYGEKPPEGISFRIQGLAGRLVSDGAKAIVLACNTATSAAAEDLRSAYPDIPVVGMEPALKPAAGEYDRVLVMATPATLALDKYKQLVKTWGTECDVLEAPCPGLAEVVEREAGEAALMQLVEELVGQYRGRVDAVVLGCTHYPLVSDIIRHVLGDVRLFDGAEGTARQLARELERHGLLRIDGDTADESIGASGIGAGADESDTAGHDDAAPTVAEHGGRVTFMAASGNRDAAERYRRVFEERMRVLSEG